MRLFPHRSPRQSSASAAVGGLESPPAGRFRRAYLHLPHSTESRSSTYIQPPSSFGTHPHQLLGDVMRLALQPRLTHVTPSLSVDHIRSPGRPRPFAPQPTAIRGRITATTGESASATRVGTLLLTDSAAWSSPSRPPTPSPVRDGLYRVAPSHVPHESLDRAHAACMPDTIWAVSGYPPDSSRDMGPASVLMSLHRVSTRQRQRTFVHRSSSRSTPDAIMSRLFDNVQDDAG